MEAQRLAMFLLVQCNLFAASRGGRAVRCCGKPGPRRALARGGMGQQARGARCVAPPPLVSDGLSPLGRLLEIRRTTSPHLRDGRGKPMFLRNAGKQF